MESRVMADVAGVFQVVLVSHLCCTTSVCHDNEQHSYLGLSLTAEYSRKPFLPSRDVC